MPWYQYLSYFFGGVFLVNAVPHFVAGLLGKALQSPFAKPPGEGLSSSKVNFLWGAFNFAIAYLLLCQVGGFDLHSWIHVLTAGAGGLLIGIMMSGHFGRFHGGDLKS